MTPDEMRELANAAVYRTGTAAQSGELGLEARWAQTAATWSVGAELKEVLQQLTDAIEASQALPATSHALGCTYDPERGRWSSIALDCPIRHLEDEGQRRRIARFDPQG